MKKWNLIVDIAKCENCHNCTLANKDEFVGNSFPGYAEEQPIHNSDWIKIERKVRGEGSMVEANYQPTMCNHCDNAPCMKAGADGSVKKRKDGIIIIDPVKAKGRRDLVDSCPYNAIWWNEKLEVPQIWIFDAHLLDQGWKEPRCAQSCPTRAFEAVKISDEEMKKRVTQDNLTVSQPELKTRPRVYYKNIQLMESEFLSGSVVSSTNDVSDCVGDAKVILCKGEEELATTTTDFFGDFKFDGLRPNSGQYTLKISHPKYGNALQQTELVESRYVEDILLEM